MTTYSPVVHPGTPIPPDLRSWSAPWPTYAPVDITPPELRAPGLPASIAEGWAQGPATLDELGPADWAARLDLALLPFTCDDRWRPLNPAGRTGRCGRNLGRWGENLAADPIVIAGQGAERHVLLIKRSDVGQWAIPGGMVDPGETAPAALVRELREETGVSLAEVDSEVLSRTHVADWRETDHAWVTSTVAVFHLPMQVTATAADDATDAAWWPLSDLATLTAALAPAGGLYEPHRPLLAAALDHLAAAVALFDVIVQGADGPASHHRGVDAETARTLEAQAWTDPAVMWTQVTPA
jgi:ADP-ribose pyrophosphatase